ncbi:Dbl homology domain-containing protein [Phialemonium atrogriseum]|uniref:Dbl homology domain-containing protein n=1 Tax=Phialemonium atrogriseum TaxID=1093897 RepID=A0AAJ0BSX6_9PEZI|nr:Dbl domain-containing protein [Phialemonium atrogriseum]KAK1763913.1 Dbl homology domain-containing protein [Phialemonium atrogriseum]
MPDDEHRSINVPEGVDSNEFGATHEEYSHDSDPSQDETVREGVGSEGLDEKKSQGPTKEEQHQLIQRFLAINNLLTLESTFVGNMRVVRDIYKGTTEACPKLAPESAMLIFRNIDELVDFHFSFFFRLRFVALSYHPSNPRLSAQPQNTKEITIASDPTNNPDGPEDAEDRQTSIGCLFVQHMEQMEAVHEDFSRGSDLAAVCLRVVQDDPAVKIWLDECNEVASHLVTCPQLDLLLEMPLQHMARYLVLIDKLLQFTPADHPDRPSLMSTRTSLEAVLPSSGTVTITPEESLHAPTTS